MLPSSPSKPPWDRRAWFLGLFLGNLAGLLLFCACYPTSRRLLESAFPYTAFGYDADDLLVIVSVGLGMILAPAIMSGIAKRFYALWGLLPFPPFAVWFLAAAVVARVPIDLDGSVVLSTTVICWGTSSWPVSLVRYYRQRHRKITVPPARSAFEPPPRSRFAAISVIAAVTALVLLGWYNLKHQMPPRIAVRTSWRLGTEAHIPLIVNDRRIYINAWLSGKKEVCRIDTGMNTVEWSKRLHLWGSPTRKYGQSCDPIGGCVDTQTVVLPHVRIGDYEVAGLPADAVGIDLNPLSVFRSAGANPEVTLGNAAFVQTVMTIDYRNKELILRPSKYNFIQQHRKEGDRVLQMHWTTDDGDSNHESRLYGWPAVRVSLAGASFWCTLDTGWDGPELGLTDDFVKHHPSVGRAKHDLFQFGAMHGSAQVERLHDLNVTIPCSWPPHTAPISLRMDGLVTPTFYGGEGVIGLALMKRYRITIDYQRRRVLLEPYAQAASGQKQEKTPPRAKQRAL